jgi:FAD/FMN-containing dehydrogenase
MGGKVRQTVDDTAAFVNSADDDVEEPEQGYYGPSADRLRRVKRGYDPTNVFSHAGSIKP